MEYEFCTLCKDAMREPNHKNCVKHRFNFFAWSYQNNRKALMKNRHGVEMEVLPEVSNRFPIKFNYVRNKGKYIIQVTPELLQIHQNKITFKCKLTNKRATDIYITNVNFLNPHGCFTMVYHHQIVFYEETMLLQSGQTFNFTINFAIEETGNFSFKIPFSCDLQSDKKDAKEVFSLLRTLALYINDDDTENGAYKESPFTREAWAGMKTFIPHTEEKTSKDQYPIPLELMRIFRHGLEDFAEINPREERELNRIRDVIEELTMDNYSDYWHNILWLEERQQSYMLTKYNMANVKMRLRDDVLLLEVPGLAEKRPSVIDGDIIKIRIHGDHTLYRGLVLMSKKSETEIEIHHVDEDLLSCIKETPNMPLDVQFVLGRLSFERAHAAVKQIHVHRLVNYMFPDQHNLIKFNDQNRYLYSLQDSEFYNQEVVKNAEQKRAVLEILNFRQQVPYIVFGPPGTGKTVTLVEVILQIRRKTNKKILVTAPSNSACDNIAMQLMRHCSNTEMIRMISESRERGSLSQKLRSYCNIDEDNEVYRIDVDALKKFKIVISTLVMIGRYSMDYRPDCVFIDEAAQASEPESAIAIAMTSIGKLVVLAGDPKQLGPMVSKTAIKFNLHISLLERLMSYEMYQPDPRSRKYNSCLITMLKENYRSHETILCIPNELFYDNNLEAKSVEALTDPIANMAIFPRINGLKNGEKGKGSAVEFYSVSSKEQREGNSPSFFNVYEVAIVKKYVRALMNLNVEKKVTAEDIGIVTPYKRQVHKIKEALRKNGYEAVEVGTTEAFQGREKRIIIISTVRAQHSLLKHDKKFNLGFVNTDQRFNVALTRAKSKLIVVGCPLVLTTDTKWGRYVDLCRNYNTFFGDTFTPRLTSDFKETVLNLLQGFNMQDSQYNRNVN